MGDQGHDLPMGDAVAAQLVGHETNRFLSLTLQDSSKESPRCAPVPTRLYEDIDHVPVLIHRAPEILALPVDRDEDFVQEPRRVDLDGASIGGRSQGRTSRTTAEWSRTTR